MRVAGVDAERRLKTEPKVRAEIVNNPFGMPRLAGNVCLAELGVEACILCDSCDRNMIGMCVRLVGDEHRRGPMFSNDGGEFVSAGEIVRDFAIFQTEV